MKINNIIGVLVVIGMTVVAGFQVKAQTVGGGPVTPPTVAIPDSLPMIGSVAEIQAYAWEHVAQIGVQGWAQSSIHAKTNDVSNVWLNYAPTNGLVDVEEIFDIVKAQRLTLSVLYPSDTVSMGSYLYDQAGNYLFGANNSGAINPPVNGMSMNTIDLRYEMNDRIVVPFPDVQWYYIVERDANGNAIRYWSPSEWDLRNGGFTFPGYFAGKNGEIVITRLDGTQVAYGLGNGGQRIMPISVGLQAGNVSALGFRTVRNNMVVNIEITGEELQRNINPLTQFIFEGEKDVDLAYFNASLKDPATSQVTEVASTVHIWRMGQPSSTGVDVNAQTWTRLERGRYWVKFNFRSGFGQSQNQFQPPYQDGGGKAVATTEVTK